MDGAKAFGSEVTAGSVRIGMCQQRCRVVQYTLAGCGRVLVGAGVPSSQPALATVVDAMWLGVEWGALSAAVPVVVLTVVVAGRWQVQVFVHSQRPLGRSGRWSVHCVPSFVLGSVGERARLWWGRTDC